MLRLLAATAFGSLGASAQETTPPVESIDSYGSSIFDSAAIRAGFGADILHPAYQILAQVSGNAFGAREYAAWERWAASR